MPVSIDIFELVKSMNRKEKAFFRRYIDLHSAGREGSSLKLFDKLVDYSSRNEKYDEEKLKRSLDEEATRHFAVTKNKLYNLILKSMHEYSEEDTNEKKVKTLIEQHDILFARSLLKQSGSILKKAKRMAEDNELYNQLHIILNRERILVRYTEGASDYEKATERLEKEHKLNFERMMNLNDMNFLGVRFISMLQKYPTSMVRDENALNEFNKIINHPLLSDETKMLTNTTLMRFYNFKLVAYEWTKDYENALHYALKYSGHVEKSIAKGKASIHEYIVALYSVLVQASRAVKYESYETAYIKLSQVHMEFANITERDKFEAMYYLGLSIFSLSSEGRFPERGNAMLIYAEEHLAHFERILSSQQKIIWYFVIARLYFFLERYSECGMWLNRLIGLPNVDLSEDYQCYGRIMSLVVAYESGNPDAIEHSLRRAFYFLTKRNKVYSYEKIILKYIKESFKVKSENEVNEMLELMHRELSSIYTDSFEKNAFDAFDILPWLESKIKHKSKLL